MKVNVNALMVAIEENERTLSNWDFCLACGEQQDRCEPDARNYECDSCGVHEVHGAEEILLMGEYE
mgnify:CR=1 FL=1